MDIVALLDTAKEKQASDLHLITGSPPMLRIRGSLTPADGLEVLAAADIDAALAQLAAPEQCQTFRDELELDFAYAMADGGRVRCNVAWQQGSIKLSLRLLPSKIASIADLGLPDVCRELILRPRGLVVITGPTGSGKSTTLAAMIDHLNNSECRHIITIEDPIEYVYTGGKCVISQRELGSDTRSFAQALKHVLRQDPDVILVGEMRDPETAAAVLNVAETGHLILTTGHAPSSSQAVERIVDLFPPHERSLVQSRLASLLLGVVSQTLLPTADGLGRVAAIEVMLGNPAVKNLIREGKIYQLPNIIRTNTRDGMVLLDQALVELFRRGTITRESMLAFCNDKEEVQRMAGNGGAPNAYGPDPAGERLDASAMPR